MSVQTKYYYGKKIWDCTETPTGLLTKNELKAGEFIMLSKKKIYKVLPDNSWKRLKKKELSEFKTIL